MLQLHYLLDNGLSSVVYLPLHTNSIISIICLRNSHVLKTFKEACIYKKVSGSSVAFLISYVDDILLIGNDIEFLDSIKGYLNKSF